MSFRLSPRSRARLKGVHPALVGVIEAAILTSPVDFMVTEGPAHAGAPGRSGQRRGQPDPELAPHHRSCGRCRRRSSTGPMRWDWPLYPRIAEAIKAAAKVRGVALVWGGDWPRLRDGPHFELDRKVFP